MALFIIKQREMQFLNYSAVTLRDSRAPLKWPHSPRKYSEQVTTGRFFGVLGGQVNVHHIANGVPFT